MSLARPVSGVAAALTASASLLALTPSAAHATDADTVVMYTCALSGLGTHDGEVRVELDQVPDSARAGSVITLGGDLTMKFPKQAAMQARLSLASTAKLEDTSFGLQFVSGSSGRRVGVRSLASKAQPIGETLVVSAEFELAGYTVPANVPGELLVAMPSGTPAFGAEIVHDGMTKARNATCALDDGTRPVVARVPVAAAAVPQSQPSPNPTSTSTTSATTTSDSEFDTLDSDDDADSPAVGAALTDEPANVDAPPTATTPAASIEQIPPSTLADGIHLPIWLLVLLGSLPPLSAIAYAVVVHRRFHRTRALADGVPGSAR